MVASTYFTLSDRLDIDRWLIAVSALPRRDRWHTLARLTLREDLYRSVRLLTRDVVTEAAVGGNADRLIAEWERDNWAHVQRAGARLENWPARHLMMWHRYRWPRVTSGRWRI